MKKTIVHFPRSGSVVAKQAVKEAEPQLTEEVDDEPLEDKTLQELKDLAAEYEIAGRSTMNKAQLIKAIEKAENL